MSGVVHVFRRHPKSDRPPQPSHILSDAFGPLAAQAIAPPGARGRSITRRSFLSKRRGRETAGQLIGIWGLMSATDNGPARSNSTMPAGWRRQERRRVSVKLVRHGTEWDYNHLGLTIPSLEKSP